MTNEGGNSGERQWLTEPPGPQEMHFQIAAGDQVKMTPEVRAAFEHFLEALADDTEAYSLNDGCAGYTKGCTEDNFACMPRAKCTWEVQKPCFVDYQCKIANLG
jgi:hypothetical protein